MISTVCIVIVSIFVYSDTFGESFMIGLKSIVNYSTSKSVYKDYKVSQSIMKQIKKLKANANDNYNDAVGEFTFENGFRSVIPYIHEFKSFAKGRWIGKELLTLLVEEFGAHPKEYWISAISQGHVRMNNNIVSTSYIVKNSDLLTHRTHRHEPPVIGNIELVGETDDVIAISKPATLPVHSCGAYRFNSLMYILAKEPLIQNQPSLSLIHRLDRVTSGLMVIAKSKRAAQELSQLIRDRTTKKTYLARVKGKFPLNLRLLNKLPLPYLLDIDMCDINDDVDHDDDQPSIEKSSERSNRKRKLTSTLSDISPIATMNDECISEIDKNNSNQQQLELLYQSPHVGYYFDDIDRKLYLRCPIGVISHRQGVYSCNVNGKVSVSIFKDLGYDEISDTSLIECQLVTGRTHQLRLHLQFLGNPIANDPCYGGQLYYGQPEKRQQAIDLLRDMKSRNYHPVCKPPHLDDDIKNEVLQNGLIGRNVVELKSNTDNSALDNDSVLSRRDSESDDEYLIRSCRYCRDKVSYESESILHCDGIWLHALRFEYEGHWKFETKWPEWSLPFKSSIQKECAE